MVGREGEEPEPSSAVDVASQQTRVGGWLFLRGDVPDPWLERAVPTWLVPLVPEECESLLATGRVEPKLEPSQAELLSLLTGGASVNQAARSLNVAPRTVQRQLAKLRALFGVSSTPELIAEAARRGF